MYSITQGLVGDVLPPWTALIHVLPATGGIRSESIRPMQGRYCLPRSLTR
jgi:hypothetical protein